MKVLKTLLMIVCVVYSGVLSCSKDNSVEEIDLPGVGVTGKVIHHGDFASEYVASRNVDVWLLPRYEENTIQRYAWYICRRRSS
jgi:hypothetical protein